MSTVATAAVTKLAADWETKCGLKSAKTSGIIGDRDHQLRGGYHIGRAFQPADNYSVVRPDDKGGPADAASAIDMTMSAADMKLCTNRLMVAYSSATDPRRKYLNAFNGTVDGKSARRWDVYARKTEGASSDHLWHVHLEIRRKYVNSPTAMSAVLSVLQGESVAAYMKAIGVTVPALSPGQPLAPAVPKFPGVLVRSDVQGKPNPNVRLFQKRMIERGWTSIKADGLFGPKLELVIKKFQTQCGVKADGVIGPTTWPLPWTRPIGH